jgi:molybdopterin-binding protein
MSAIRIRDAAELLGVSDDTVRRWIDGGSLSAHKDEAGRKVFVGLVTKVTTDQVMAEVQMQCGPFTVVSLMSSESAGELGLEPGKVAVAVVKATTVIIETPGGTS